MMRVRWNYYADRVREAAGEWVPWLGEPKNYNSAACTASRLRCRFPDLEIEHRRDPRHIDRPGTLRARVRGRDAA